MLPHLTTKQHGTTNVKIGTNEPTTNFVSDKKALISKPIQRYNFLLIGSTSVMRLFIWLKWK